MTYPTIWVALGHWRGRTFFRRGVWHELRIDARGSHPSCVRVMNMGGADLEVAPDTIARIKAGALTDVPKGRFCKRCLARVS